MSVARQPVAASPAGCACRSAELERKQAVLTLLNRSEEQIEEESAVRGAWPVNQPAFKQMPCPFKPGQVRHLLRLIKVP